jgi:hypothetical protein
MTRDEACVEAGRIALRIEGDQWVAYYAREGTMDGALRLASIYMDAVRNQRRKEAFMALMRDYVSDLIENAVGERPDWNDPERAPEHEKAGRA